MSGAATAIIERVVPIGSLGRRKARPHTATGSPARDLLAGFIRFAGWRQLGAAAVLILVAAALEGVGILLLVQLFQLVLDPDASGSAHGMAAAWQLLGELGEAKRVQVGFGAFALLVALRGLMLTARDSLLARLQQGFVEETKQRLFASIASASWTSVIKIDRARLVQMLGSEILQMAIAVRYALQAGVAVLMLAGLALFALTLAPSLALFTLAFVAAAAAATSRFMHRAGLLGRTLLHHDLSLAQIATRFLAALKLAKAQGVQGPFLKRHSEASKASMAQRIAFARTVSIARNLVTIAAALAAAAVILVGMLAFEVAPPVLIAFALVLSRMTSPALVVQEGLQQIAHNMPRFELLRSLNDELASAPGPAAADDVGERPSRGGAIILDRVSFRRSSERVEGLFDISLAAATGELFGIAGASGSGKTTLLDIIAGLIAPDSGIVSIAGRVLSPGAMAHHSAQLSYVGQESVLFAGSLRDNLRWSAPEATDAAIWRALELVGADRLARRNSAGLDAVLADGGGNFSAGERQRLALAGALLRRPKLLLLDEATSSLDAASERAVLDAIGRLRPRPTVLFVSHRTESLALCERVVTLAEGRIVRDTAPRDFSRPTTPPTEAGECYENPHLETVRAWRARRRLAGRGLGTGATGAAPVHGDHG